MINQRWRTFYINFQNSTIKLKIFKIYIQMQNIVISYPKVWSNVAFDDEVDLNGDYSWKSVFVRIYGRDLYGTSQLPLILLILPYKITWRITFTHKGLFLAVRPYLIKSAVFGVVERSRKHPWSMDRKFRKQTLGGLEAQGFFTDKVFLITTVHRIHQKVVKC